MAITTYAQLVTAVQNWLDNTNTLPDARVAEFVALAEADFNARIRVRENLIRGTGAFIAGDNRISIPDRYVGTQLIAICHQSYGGPLAQMDEAAALDAYYGEPTGLPRHWVMENTVVRVYPTPDYAYDYVWKYWQKVSALAADSDTNWILTGHPDVYLFGALSFAEGYLVNDARVPFWRAQYEAALNRINTQSVEDSFSGRTMMYVEGATP